MSQPYALLIVGGGPAGLAAARSYRDAGGEGRVAIVTDEDRMPYRRPPLTKELLRSLRVEHWGDALIQGTIAGRTAAGLPAGWDSVRGFWSTIGRHTLKYAAWGDGYTESRLERHADKSFTIWYGNDGKLVGVLTHEADEDYERGKEHITQGAAWS